ncbi:MAG: hypothetical protein IPK83_20380 [Planctomycetes bacterium]|nr:hypothetical protein [Planctomycetota bacterium]
MRKMILCALVSVVFPTLAFAATASWDAVADPTLQGYRLYRAPGACATPGAFATVQSYGVVTSGAIPNPTVNGTYCHKLTAFNPVGESLFSNTAEFSYTVNPPPAPTSFSVTP